MLVQFKVFQLDPDPHYYFARELPVVLQTTQL